MMRNHVKILMSVPLIMVVVMILVSTLMVATHVNVIMDYSYCLIKNHVDHYPKIVFLVAMAADHHVMMEMIYVAILAIRLIGTACCVEVRNYTL